MVHEEITHYGLYAVQLNLNLMHSCQYKQQQTKVLHVHALILCVFTYMSSIFCVIESIFRNFLIHVCVVVTCMRSHH